MNEYRVLWIDAAGEGRFTSIKAESEAEAAWGVAINTDSNLAAFEGIIFMGEPAVMTTRPPKFKAGTSEVKP